MNYLKKGNGTTTVVQKGYAPEPVKYFETKAYRDPDDLVTGKITNGHFVSFSSKTVIIK